MPDKPEDKLERYEMFYEEIGSFQLFDNLDLTEAPAPDEAYDQSFMSSDAVSQLSRDAHGDHFSEQIAEAPQSEQDSK